MSDNISNETVVIENANEEMKAEEVLQRMIAAQDRVHEIRLLEFKISVFACLLAYLAYLAYHAYMGCH